MRDKSTDDKPTGGAAALTPFVKSSITSTALLWVATAAIYALARTQHPVGPPQHLTPSAVGAIIALASTVMTLCAFTNTTGLPRRPMWLVIAPWLAITFAATDRLPLVPTRAANMVVFLALATSYARRADVRRRKKRSGVTA